MQRTRPFAGGLSMLLALIGLSLLVPSGSIAQMLGTPPRLDSGYLEPSQEIPPPLAAGSVQALAIPSEVPPIDTGNRVAVRNAFNQFYAPPMPPMGWSGSIATCMAGTISAEFKEFTIRRVNFVRAMAGVPGNIMLNETNSAKAQQAALMMAAQRQLSHTPPPSWACYTAEGAEAAGKSNLALGADDVIPLYMSDPGQNNYFVGHRRWILHSRQTAMGVGSTPNGGGQLGGNALWVLTDFGSPLATPDGIPWPPRGFTPLVLFPASSRWSFSYPSANFANASVAMTANGMPVPLTITSQADNGYGDNTIVWSPTLTVAKGAVYVVSITGVSGTGVPTSFTYTVRPFDPADPYFVRADTNGDGRSDVLLRHTNGTNYIWQIDGTSISNNTLSIPSQGYLPGLDASWSIAATGDFNGDGKADVLLRHANGTNYVWHLDGGSIESGSITISSHGYLPGLDVNWSIAGVGDFNGDGKSDILLRHTNGTNYIWHVDGANIAGGSLTILSQGYLPPLDPNWTIAGVGDFNGDGKADVVLRHANGTNYVWHLNGNSFQGQNVSIVSHGYLPGLDPSWSIAGVGDFNGDGKADVLLRHTNGTNYVWHVDGASIVGATLDIPSHGYLPGLDGSWSVAAVGDFNGDGKSDVLLRHTNGTNYVWHLDGSSIAGATLAIPSQGYLPALDAAWSIVKK